MFDEKWINVHTYDGSLVGKFFSQFPSNKERKVLLFTKLYNTLSSLPAKEMIFTILENVKNNERIIHDGIDQSDVLFEIVMFFENGDLSLLPTFEEQLSDTKLSGTCPSGRVTRMFQFWKSAYTIVYDEDFRENVRKTKLIPISVEEKNGMFYELKRHSANIVIQKLVKTYENNEMIYYDGINIHFLLANVCKNNKEKELENVLQSDFNIEKIAKTMLKCL